MIGNFSPALTAEVLFPPRGGLLDATPLEMLLETLFEGMKVEETAIPFIAIATPFETNEPEALSTGNLAKAIHASMAIPGLFAPVDIGRSYYYDGGIKAAVPVLTAKEIGARVIIASDVTKAITYDPRNLLANLEIIIVDIVEGFNRVQLEAADIILDPGLHKDSYMSFDRSTLFVEKGYQETQKKLPEILELLNERSISLSEAGDPNAANPLNAAWQERLQAGRRHVAHRPRPLSLGVDVGLEPSHYQSGVTLPDTAPLSVGRVGLSAADGVFGPFKVGAAVGFSLNSDATRLAFRLGYRPVYDLELGAAVEKALDGAWDFGFGVTYHYSDFAGLEGAATLALHVPRGETELGGRLEARGLLAQAGVGLSRSFAWGTIDLRTALAFDTFTVRARGFAGGVSAAAPRDAYLGFGQPVLMRGVALTPARTVLVANLEAGWQAANGSPFAEAVLLRPELWGFVDVGHALPEVAPFAVSIGVGAGVSGALFGFEPFALSFDLGYGLNTGDVSFGLRTRVWPEALELARPTAGTE